MQSIKNNDAEFALQMIKSRQTSWQANSFLSSSMFGLTTPALLLPLALLTACSTAQVCQESGYCSSASVKPYFGDIFSGKVVTSGLKSLRRRGQQHVCVDAQARVCGRLCRHEASARKSF